jgi:hypothetical protein
MDYAKHMTLKKIFSRTSEPLTVKQCNYELENEGTNESMRNTARHLQVMDEYNAIKCINPDEKPYKYIWCMVEVIMTLEEALLLYPYIKQASNNFPKKAISSIKRKKVEQAIELLEDIKVKNPQGKVAKWLSNDELIDECSDVYQVVLARTFNNSLFDNDELLITYSRNSGKVSEMMEPDGMIFLNKEFHLRVNPINGFKVSTIKLSDVSNIEVITHTNIQCESEVKMRQAA